MKEFYEPMLYLSSPEHPNTMGVLAVLTEAVDGELLRDAVEELRTRFPYFYVKAEQRENDLLPVPNHDGEKHMVPDHAECKGIQLPSRRMEV